MNQAFLAFVAARVIVPGPRFNRMITPGSVTERHVQGNPGECSQLETWFAGVATSGGTPGQCSLARLHRPSKEQWWTRLSPVLQAIEHERAVRFGLLWFRSLDAEPWAPVLAQQLFAGPSASSSMVLLAAVGQSLGTLFSTDAPVLVLVFALQTPRLDTPIAQSSGWIQQPMIVPRLSDEDCTDLGLGAESHIKPALIAHDLVYMTAILGEGNGHWLPAKLDVADFARHFVL